MRRARAATFDEAIAGAGSSSTSGRPGAARASRSSRSSRSSTDRVPVARLNIDEYPEIASRYEVLSIPTVMLFADGEPRGSVGRRCGRSRTSSAG